MKEEPESDPKDDRRYSILTTNLPAALEDFAITLENVLITRRSERSDRERYKLLLIAVAHFLKNIQAPREFANAYVDLAYMLEDLEAGKTHPVLRANSVGAPPDSTDAWMRRADIALGVVAVMAAGKRQQAAAEYVAKQIGPALDRVRRSRKGEAWRAVLEWYNAFSARDVKNDIAQDAFNGNVDTVRALVTAKPETERLAAATRYLRRAREKILSN